LYQFRQLPAGLAIRVVSNKTSLSAVRRSSSIARSGSGTHLKIGDRYRTLGQDAFKEHLHGSGAMNGRTRLLCRLLGCADACVDRIRRNDRA
jgi:hypothetical protein